MKPSELLREARKLIENPEHWIQGLLERTAKDGQQCFCSWGAVNRTTNTAAKTDRSIWITETIAWLALCRQIPEGQNMIGWQDQPGRTHAEVLEKFDKAIIVLEVQHQ